MQQNQNSRQNNAGKRLIQIDPNGNRRRQVTDHCLGHAKQSDITVGRKSVLEDTHPRSQEDSVNLTAPVGGEIDQQYQGKVEYTPEGELYRDQPLDKKSNKKGRPEDPRGKFVNFRPFSSSFHHCRASLTKSTISRQPA